MREERADHTDLLLAAATKLEEAATLLRQVQQSLIDERVRAVTNVLGVLTPTKTTHH